MMNFKYAVSQKDIRKFVSSYYDVDIPNELSDFMRAEIANIRVILNGEVQWHVNGQLHQLVPGDAVLCGPTFSASPIQFAKNTHVIGMAITPIGWAHMFDLSAEDMADDVRVLQEHIPSKSLPKLARIVDADDHISRIKAVDDFMSSLVQERDKIHTDFLDYITKWLIDPEPNELNDLLSGAVVSPRQIDRLCRLYFGASPKKLHRKFRALHSANRLTWQQLTDWRDVALTAYSDQSHFIREFKQFNGRTPQEFIKGAHILVKQTLEQRLQIEHESPFSLVG